MHPLAIAALAFVVSGAVAFDGWRLHDEKMRGSGGQTCGRLALELAP